jgi:HAD superfamily hydrolase (TIGR01549 family)
LKAVVFDAGETLVNERRLWQLWAAWLKVPDHVLFAVLGAVIERGEHHHRVFDLLQPGFDLRRASEQRRMEGWPDTIEAADLYPDAIACMAALRSRGLRVCIAGNQPEDFERVIRDLELPVDLIASSARWNVEKPSPRFFRKIAEELSLPAESIAYVGDRLDNDILPAREAGFFTVFIRRGPWGFLHAGRPEAALADLRIESLSELEQALDRANALMRPSEPCRS